MHLITAAVLSLVAGVAFGVFGAGGSILLVPILVYVLGLPVKVSLGMALLILTATGAVTALAHARTGHIRPGIGVQWAALGLVGSYAGGRIAGLLPGQLLITVFACVIVMASLRMLRGNAPLPGSERERASWRVLAMIGFALGLFTGTLGVGGGFLLVPALVLIGGLDVKPAIGTSAMIISINSVGGFLGFASHTHFPFPLTATVALCNVVGSLAGSRLGAALPSRRLRPAFAVFLLSVGSVMVARNLLHLLSH